VTCRVLGFTKQGFYKWCAKPISDCQRRLNTDPVSSPEN
jgi:hypothetical protein